MYCDVVDETRARGPIGSPPSRAPQKVRFAFRALADLGRDRRGLRRRHSDLRRLAPCPCLIWPVPRTSPLSMRASNVKGGNDDIEEESGGEVGIISIRTRDAHRCFL